MTLSILKTGALIGALLFMGCSCQHVPQPRVLQISNVDPKTISDTVRLGVVTGDALREIEKEWNGHDPYQVERAKCVEEYGVSHMLHSGLVLEIYSVTKFDSAAAVDSASPQRIIYGCEGRPRFHTHPPSHCERVLNPLPAWSCTLTRFYERHCRPSTTDEQVLARLQLPFSLVQCGPRTVAFYFPPAPDTTKAPTAIDSIPSQIIPHIPSHPR